MDDPVPASPTLNRIIQSYGSEVLASPEIIDKYREKAQAELDELKRLVRYYAERTDFWQSMCP